MCIFDCLKRTKGWKADPSASLNDNLFLGSVHFCEVFFNKYRINRHNNAHDFDDMAADCSIAVYDAAIRNIDKWDREKYRLDQYIYGRAWSIVGVWLRDYFRKKQRSPIDVRNSDDNRLTPREYDVGLDEIESNNYGNGTRYVVFKEAPLTYYEKKLSSAANEYLDYVDECEYLGVAPVDPEDFLTNKSSLETDIRYLKKILNEKSPSKTAKKKCRRPSLERL